MPQADSNSIAEVAKNGRIEHAFATPIFSYVFKNVDALNVQLRELVLEREHAMPSMAKSNQGGWQSSPDFFRWGGTAIEALEDYVRRALTVATAHLRVPQGIKIAFDLYGWAAVNRRGHYNTTHVHPMSTWSGVYYVDPGDEASDQPDAVLEFAHPITASVMTFFPGLLPSARIVRPEPGMVILFPSYLQHSVRIYKGQRPRICVSFNAHMRTMGA
ncbi:MAG: TIGR02466 family protein [Methyloceanibacter sp.]